MTFLKVEMFFYNKFDLFRDFSITAASYFIINGNSLTVRYKFVRK